MPEDRDEFGSKIVRKVGDKDEFGGRIVKSATAPPPPVADKTADQPGRTFGESAIEFAKGAGKQLMRLGSNFADIASLGTSSLVEGKRVREERAKLLRYENTEQELGGAVAETAEMFVPLPGVSEIKAAAGAGRLAKLGMTALRGSVDVGAKTFFQTGDPVKAAETAAVAGPVGAGVEAASGPFSALLKRVAASQYGKVLHPLGRKAKEAAMEHIPEVLESGYGKATAATSHSLSDKFLSEATSLGQKIEAEYQALDATTQTKVKPIYDDMYDFIYQKAFTKTGTVKDPAILQAGIEKLREVHGALGPYLGDAPPSVVWEVRQALDRYVYPAGQFGASEAVQAGNFVRTAAANSIRSALNSQHPSLQQLNSTYHLWRGVSDLMQRNITNETGKLQFYRNTAALGRFVAGAAIGAEGAREAHQGPWGMGTSAVLMGLAMESTAWRTVSAVTKNKIANLLITGQGARAADLAARSTGVAMSHLGQ